MGTKPGGMGGETPGTGTGASSGVFVGGSEMVPIAGPLTLMKFGERKSPNSTEPTFCSTESGIFCPPAVPLSSGNHVIPLRLESENTETGPAGNRTPGSFWLTKLWAFSSHVVALIVVKRDATTR